MYKRWCYKQVTQANCAPAGLGLALLIAGVLIGIHYWTNILTTIKVVAISITSVAAISLLGAIAFTAIKWRRRQVAATAAPEPALTMQNSTLEGAMKSATLAQAADELAKETVTLRWTPDRKSIEVVDKQ